MGVKNIQATIFTNGARTVVTLWSGLCGGPFYREWWGPIPFTPGSYSTDSEFAKQETTPSISWHRHQ